MLIPNTVNRQLKEFSKSFHFPNEVTKEFLDNIIVTSKEINLASADLGKKIASNPRFMFDWAQSYRDRKMIVVAHGQMHILIKEGIKVSCVFYSLDMKLFEGLQVRFDDPDNVFGNCVIFSEKGESKDPVHCEKVSKAACPYIMLMMFLDTVDLEHEILQPKTKSKILKTSEGKNQSDFKARRVYSTWFKTLILNHGFEVNGHWRQQRCGKGLAEIKTTWVRPYVKQGYTRRADIERNPALQL
jgi:hypothetical protein